jgi:hypothetical protein
MSSSNESYLFDATNYPDFEKAIALGKRLGGPTESFWLRGVPTIIIFVAVFTWLVLTGGADEQPIALVVIAFMAVIVTAAVLYMRFRNRDDPRVPVRLTSSGYLVIGDRRWPVDGIGRIVAFGCSGAVDIKDKDGRTIALPYRAQFGSFDDFMQVLRRLRPDLDVERESANVKVRLPQGKN